MSRDINPFGLRMPPELRERLERAARESGRSMNAELVHRLEESFPLLESELLTRQQEELANVGMELARLHDRRDQVELAVASRRAEIGVEQVESDSEHAQLISELQHIDMRLDLLEALQKRFSAVVESLRAALGSARGANVRQSAGRQKRGGAKA